MLCLKLVVDVLHPVVGTLGAGSRFCACYEGGRSPAAEATAMAELVIDEVEECVGSSRSWMICPPQDELPRVL